MNSVLLVLLSMSLAYSLTGVVFFSPLTPPSILSGFDQVMRTSSSDILACNISDSVLHQLQVRSAHVLFDYTYSFIHSLTLRALSESLKIPCFHSGSPPKDIKVTGYEYYLHADNELEAFAIRDFLNHLNQTEFYIVSDSSHAYIASQLGQYHLISSLSPQHIYDKLVRHTVKPSGNWKILILSDEVSSEKMFKSMLKANIYKERSIFVAYGRGGAQQFNLGALVIGEERIGMAESIGELEALSVIRAFDLIKDLSSQDVIRELEKITENHGIPSNFSIYNYRTEGTREEIGKISPVGIDMFSDIVFPGNSSKFTTSKPIIQISANLGIVNYNGAVSFQHQILTLGLVPMISIINADESLLQNYELQLYGTDCGPRYFNYKYGKACMLRHKENLKGFFIDGVNEEMIRGNMKVFEDIGVPIPHITSYIYQRDLYNKTAYPNLLITSGFFGYSYSILPYILKSFGWENILLLYSIDEGNYEIFTNNCEALGINILNSKQFLRVSTGNEKSSDFYQEFAEIKASKCRILVSLMYVPYDLRLATWLYDFGFRRGDLVFISTSRSSSYIDYPEWYSHDKKKALEIIDGSLSLDYLEYVGEYGENLQKQIASRVFPFPTHFTSFLINSMLLGVHTLDTLIECGLDHEDNDLVSKFIRKENFLGTSGTVSIDSGGNGINEIRFGIFNLYVQNETWAENHIGDYTLGVLVPLNYSREIVWPNGSLVIPEDLIRQYPCENAETPRQKSRLVIHIILGICSLCVIGIGCKMFRLGVAMMTEVRDIMFEDAILMYTPIIEVIQYSALIPDFNHFLVLLGSVASFELENLATWDYEQFWESYFIVLGVAVLWILCVIIPATKIFTFLPVRIQDFIYYIGYVYFTFISQIGFIPIVKTLLKIFMCSDGLIYDCSVDCWKGYHLFLCVVTGIVVFVYVVCSTLMKAVVDDNMEAVNIKTVPLFICFKTLFHLALLLLYFGKFENSDIYFFVSLATWGAIACKVKGYNYERFNFWQKMLILWGVLNALLILIHGQIGNKYTEEFCILQVIILSSIGIIGFIAQRRYYSSMLYRKPGSNIQKLIRFSFGRITERDLTMTEFTYVYRENDIENQGPKNLEILS